MKRLLLAMIVTLPLADPIAFAESVRTVETRQTASRMQDSAEATLEQRRAQAWGLRTEEWARYRQLMQGPLGIYSPHIDPLTALGIEARSNNERRRYAELQVQAEATRVDKLLGYQRAYDDAWKRLFPSLHPVTQLDTATSLKANAASTSERVSVFVKEHCDACVQRVQQLQASGKPFDLYLVDSEPNDARLRAWTKQAGIRSVHVKTRRITINHDAGRWASLDERGELPAVMHQVNGQWQRL